MRNEYTKIYKEIQEIMTLEKKSIITKTISNLENQVESLKLHRVIPRIFNHINIDNEIFIAGEK